MIGKIEKTKTGKFVGTITKDGIRLYRSESFDKYADAKAKVKAVILFLLHCEKLEPPMVDFTF